MLAGEVFVAGVRVDKAGALVPDDAAIEVRGPDHAYVSRGGVKLAGALDAFALDVRGLRCLDLGASTGGFTDCLLAARRGAASPPSTSDTGSSRTSSASTRAWS